ncbi:phage holin family protein [Bacillus sp. FJAT-49736]|uniref:phage holin family protein n=1 Tax=Bacillus sp. FJAT-49736 TaxID=2833582 RepID=UPI001BCA4374|nr:phage holin family protein [Bacillus sp. FJAT-49736]MBS4173465.1 phage holin family protein [Bacillus sp. FJAT-49736]
MIHLNNFDITTVVGNIWYVALAFILFDVITGLLAAAVEKKLNSSISYIGLIRKVGLFVALAFLVFMDAYVSANGYIIKLGIGLIVAYEGMSIVENLSRIGINIKFLTKYFDKSKVNGDGE